MHSLQEDINKWLKSKQGLPTFHHTIKPLTSHEKLVICVIEYSELDMDSKRFMPTNFGINQPEFEKV